MADPSPIPWHPAFVQALQLELEPFLYSLEFTPELPLTSEPLRVDLIIIKKSPSLVIEKNIACIFKHTNIFEYKSPRDYISLHSFHKTLAYTFLYASLNKISLTDMTVSIVGSRHPRKLFRELGREGYGRVVEREGGIYEVVGYPVVIQIIESGSLGAEENLWLRGLSPGLKVKVLGEILEESEKRDWDRVGAYLYAVLESNSGVLEEVVEMGKKKRTWREVLEESGLTAEWEERGEVRGKILGEILGKAQGEVQGERTAWGKAISLLKQGYTVEQLEQMDPVDSRGV
jgi:hypothetical protein